MQLGVVLHHTAPCAEFLDLFFRFHDWGRGLFFGLGGRVRHFDVLLRADCRAADGAEDAVILTERWQRCSSLRGHQGSVAIRGNGVVLILLSPCF